MLQHVSVGRVQGKECYYMFTYTFLVFFCFSTNIVLLSFLSLFLRIIKFLKQNINQSKTGTGDKKFSVELHALLYFCLQLIRNGTITKRSYNCRSSHPEVFCKIAVLKNIGKFTETQLWRCVIFNEVAGLAVGLQLYVQTF